MWRRSTVVVLLFAWLALGTGALAYVHELQHGDDHAAAPYRGSDCRVHAQLHAPVMAGETAAVAGIHPALMAGCLISEQAAVVVCERSACGSRDPPLA